MNRATMRKGNGLKCVPSDAPSANTSMKLHKPKHGAQASSQQFIQQVSGAYAEEKVNDECTCSGYGVERAFRHI